MLLNCTKFKFKGLKRSSIPMPISKFTLDIHCVIDYYAHLLFSCKTRVIIKISTLPCYSCYTLTDFKGNEAKKNPKWSTRKN